MSTVYVSYGDYLNLEQFNSSTKLFEPIGTFDKPREMTDQEIDRVTDLFANHCDFLLNKKIVTLKEAGKACFEVALIASLVALATLFPHFLLGVTAIIGLVYFIPRVFEAGAVLYQRWKVTTKSDYLKFVIKQAADQEFRNQLKANPKKELSKYLWSQDSVFQAIHDHVQTKFEEAFKNAMRKEIQNDVNHRTQQV